MLILVALIQEVPTLHDQDNVHITGLGKVNAAIHATRLIHQHKPELIINFGTAGVVVGLPYRGLVECTGFVQRDMDCTPLGFEAHTTPFEEDGHMIGTTEVVCGTGDSFATDTSGLGDAGIHIVDMEAYAIAKVCTTFNIPFRCFKYISDQADEHAGKDWMEFEHAIAEQLFISTIESLHEGSV